MSTGNLPESLNRHYTSVYGDVKTNRVNKSKRIKIEPEILIRQWKNEKRDKGWVRNFNCGTLELWIATPNGKCQTKITSVTIEYNKTNRSPVSYNVIY